VAKNERQRSQNTARTQGPSGGREERKKDIEKTLATTRISTASLGKFDKKLDGEKKLRGVKRKVSPRRFCLQKLSNLPGFPFSSNQPKHH